METKLSLRKRGLIHKAKYFSNILLITYKSVDGKPTLQIDMSNNPRAWRMLKKFLDKAENLKLVITHTPRTMKSLDDFDYKAYCYKNLL
jgi:hypothetical protein